jgi:hypothetical protein
MWKVEDCPGRQRKEKRRLPTRPLKRPRLIITKMAVNFMVGAMIDGYELSSSSSRTAFAWSASRSVSRKTKFLPAFHPRSMKLRAMGGKKENILERGQHGVDEELELSH